MRGMSANIGAIQDYINGLVMGAVNDLKEYCGQALLEFGSSATEQMHSSLHQLRDIGEQAERHIIEGQLSVVNAALGSLPMALNN